MEIGETLFAFNCAIVERGSGLLERPQRSLQMPESSFNDEKSIYTAEFDE
jgi:hypothetical protein